jgi:hypothetical protein
MSSRKNIRFPPGSCWEPIPAPSKGSRRRTARRSFRLSMCRPCSSKARADRANGAAPILPRCRGCKPVPGNRSGQLSVRSRTAVVRPDSSVSLGSATELHRLPSSPPGVNGGRPLPLDLVDRDCPVASIITGAITDKTASRWVAKGPFARAGRKARENLNQDRAYF